MSIFKHKETGKCLSMGEFGHTLNGRKMILKDCELYDNITQDIRVLNKSASGTYYLKKNDKCLTKSGTESNTGVYQVEFADCNDSTSLFEITEDNRGANGSLEVKSYEGYLIFSDNRSGYLNGKTNLWGQLLTSADHEYNEKADATNSVIYYRMEDIEIVDFTGKITIDELLKENQRIKCTLKYIIEEYDENNNALNISTTYYLQSSNKRDLLFFSKTQKTDPTLGKVMILTRNRSDYIVSIYGRQTENRSNFNFCNIGAIDTTGRNILKAKLDTRYATNGLTIGHGETIFRYLPKNNIDEFKLLYHYPYADSQTQINISSYINPVKKMTYINDNHIITRNTRDGVNDPKYIYDLVPNKNDEGFTGIIEPMSSEKCNIKIIGTCQGNESIPNSTWFDDATYSQNYAQSNYECDYKKNEWKELCGENVTVKAKYTSEDLANAENLPVSATSTETNSIETQLTSLYLTIKREPQKFSTIINEINAIDVNIHSSTIGNHPAHGSGTINNIALIKSVFYDLSIVYDKIRAIIIEMLDVYTNLKLHNIFNVNTGTSITFNYTNAINTIAEANSILIRLESIRQNIMIQKEVNEPEVDFTTISINLETLQYLSEAINYLVLNQESTGSSGGLGILNIFYDYMGLNSNSTFSLCKQSYIISHTDSGDAGIKTNGTNTVATSSGNVDILTFINDSSKHVSTSKTFFDLNFGDIYDVLFTTNISSSSLRSFSESHVRKLLSSNDYLTTGIGGLFYYIGNLYKSLEEYSVKHVYYSTAKNYINGNILTLNIQSGNFYDVINGYFSALTKLATYINESSLISNCYFYVAVKYYGSSLTSSSSDKEKAVYFAYLYGTLLKKYSEGLPGEDYTAITKLEDYYNNDQIILLRYNNLMITDFVNKYNSLYSNAKAQSGLVDGDTIVDINDTAIKSTVFDGFSNIEGFSTTVNSNQATLFPTTPHGLNHRHASSNGAARTSYASDSAKLLEDGFLYQDRSNEYGTLANYYNSYVSDGSYNLSNDPFFTCNDVEGRRVDPQLSVTFNCGNVSGQSYTGVYDGQQDIFNRLCTLANNTCDFDRSIRLVHTITNGTGSDGKLELVLLENAGGSTTVKQEVLIWSYDINTFGYAVEFALEQHGAGAAGNTAKYEFNTNVNSTSNGSTVMDMLTYTENNMDLDLNGTEALFSSKLNGTTYVNDSYFKLILTKDPKDGVVKPLIQIKPIINKAILNMGGSEIGRYSGKVLTKGTNDSISLYSVNNAAGKYKLGNLVNEMGYIGTDGIYYKARGTNVNRTEKMPVLSAIGDLDDPLKNFKVYTNMRFMKPSVAAGENTIADVSEINTDSEIIGVFKETTGRSNTLYKVTNDNIKHLFNKFETPQLTTYYTDGTFYLKKMALNGGDNACITASNHTKIMNFDDFNVIPKKQLYSSGQVCGIKQVMNSYVTEFKQRRANFSTSFNNLVNAFNSLNENELLMLKNTEIKLNELNNLVKDYDELYNKAVKNKSIRLLLESQNTEFKLLHKSSEYKMAAAGIASIGALVMLFNYMKK